MELLKRISFYAFITILTSVVSFLLLPVLTKYLTPEDYGVLSIFNAFTRFIVTFLSLGSVNILMVTLVSKEQFVFNVQLRSFFYISFVNALVFSVVTLLYVLFFGDFFGLPYWLALVVPFIAFGIVVFDLVTGVTVFKYNRKQYGKIVLSKFFMEVFFSLVFIIVFNLGWLGRVSGMVMGLFFSLFVAYRYLKREGYLKSLYRRRVTKALIAQGYPLIFMSVSITVMNLSDRFFVEKMVGIADTGLYNVGAVIGGIELIIVNAVMSAVRPLIYKSLKEGRKDVKLQLLNLFVLTLTFLVIYLFNDLIFELLIDDKFHSAKQYVFPVALGFLFWGIGNYYLSYLLYYKESKKNAYISGGGMVMNLVLNYFFIQKYSALGAAYATVITYFFMAVIIYVVSLGVSSRYENIQETF